MTTTAALVGAVWIDLSVDLRSLTALVVINVLMSWCLWFPMAANQLSMSAPVAIGVGAYAAGYAALHGWGNLAVSVALGAVTGVLVGLPVGLLASRARDFALAIMTLSLVLIFQVTATNLSFLGGSVGMFAIPTADVVPAGAFAILGIVVFGVAVYRSRFGRMMDAIAADEILAGAVGIRTPLIKVAVLVPASVVGGIAGALLARYTGFVDPTQFGLALITQLFAYVVFGGLGSIWGPICGAAFLTLALQLLVTVGGARNFVFGGILIFGTLLFPQGLVRRSRYVRARRYQRHAAATFDAAAE